MRLALILGSVIVLAAISFAAYLRLVPSDPDIWHVDPRSVERPVIRGSYLLCDCQGDGPAPRFAGSSPDVMAKFDQVVMSSPRVRRMAGTPDTGHVTYIARSFLFGFPDYISVIAYPTGEGTALAIYARLRFGSADMGINQQRVQAWLAELG